MNTFGILIVEDNKGFALELEMLIVEAGYDLIGVVDNSDDALKLIKEKKPDLVIMDIDIHGALNGIEIAKMIKPDKVPVIFSTSHKDKESYDEAKAALTYAYLVKPFDMLTLQSAIEFAVKSIANDKNDDLPGEGDSWTEDLIVQDSFLIKSNGVLRKVKCSDIDYVQSDWNYCTIYSKKHKYAVKMSLKKILSTLGSLFIPIHKSYVVQLNRIDGIDTTANKVLIAGISLPLGRTFKDNLLRRFQTLK